MSIKNKSLKELYDLAYNTNEPDILKTLSSHSDSTVRRIVAKNRNTSTNTINTLALDPVLNVSYFATSHPKCTVKREYDDVSNPCISCTKDERVMTCTNCDTLNKYYQSY